MRDVLVLRMLIDFKCDISNEIPKTDARGLYDVYDGVFRRLHVGLSVLRNDSRITHVIQPDTLVDHPRRRSVFFRLVFLGVAVLATPFFV